MFRLREAVNTMPGGMSQPELVEYFGALFKDLREIMQTAAQLKQSRKEPRARIPIRMARFNDLFNGERLEVMSVTDIYEAAEALGEMPKENEGHLFSGDLECVWDQWGLYWADIVHCINQVRATKGEEKIVLNTKMHLFRLPGVSQDPRYRSPEPPKVQKDKKRCREIASDPALDSEMPLTAPKTKSRKKFKSALVINDDSDEAQPTASNKGKQRAKDNVSDVQNTISLDFLEKILHLPLLCILQQAPFPCKNCVMAENMPCYVEFGRNPGCVKCCHSDKGCSLVPKKSYHVITEPHKSMLAYLFHGHQIIQLAKGLTPYQCLPDYDNVQMTGKIYSELAASMSTLWDNIVELRAEASRTNNTLMADLQREASAAVIKAANALEARMDAMESAVNDLQHRASWYNNLLHEDTIQRHKLKERLKTQKQQLQSPTPAGISRQNKSFSIHFPTRGSTWWACIPALHDPATGTWRRGTNPDPMLGGPINTNLTSIDQTVVDPTSMDLTSVDWTIPDPTTPDPTSLDPNSADPMGGEIETVTLAMHNPGNNNVNHFVDTVSAFMVDLFQFCLAKRSNSPSRAPPNSPPHISAQLLSKIKHIVDMLVTAYLCVEYCRDCIEKCLRDGMYLDKEKAMSDQWGTWILRTTVWVQSPQMIADHYGHIMA
ncbi:hypothetical protein K474DRAFT_1672840 [Panus rudis PR-1116 ss-1]|nr:hypothetical protein K474DRAFT_1672840 [Panus rudis PR-1116 ss-1]